jgi:type III secretion protein Q
METTLATPLVLKHVDRAQAVLGNLLFGQGERNASFLLATKRYTLGFRPFGRKIPEQTALAVTVDGLEFELLVPGTFFTETVPGFPGDDALADFPPELGNALVEVAMEDLLDAFDAWASTRSMVTGYGVEPSDIGERSPRICLHLDLAREGGNRVFPVCLTFGPNALDLVTQLVGKLEPLASALPEGLTVGAGIERGRAVLTVAEFGALCPNDIILIDPWSCGQDLRVNLAPGIAFWGRHENNTVTITGKAEDKSMQEMEEKGQETLAETLAKTTKTTQTATTIDEIPMEIVFEAGEKRLTMGELKEIRPGFVFDLGKDLTQPIAIRVNGKIVGKGELVEIEGRLGVRVRELLDHAAH